MFLIYDLSFPIYQMNQRKTNQLKNETEATEQTQQLETGFYKSQ